MMQKTAQPGRATSAMPGTAYAFFNCRSRLGTINNLLPRIREFQQVPPMVETTLTRVREMKIEGDEQLAAIVKDAKANGIRYALKAVYPGETNAKAAGELAAILNQAYNSPLYREGEKFVGRIFYQTENGAYVSKK